MKFIFAFFFALTLFAQTPYTFDWEDNSKQDKNTEKKQTTPFPSTQNDPGLPSSPSLSPSPAYPSQDLLDSFTQMQRKMNTFRSQMMKEMSSFFSDSFFTDDHFFDSASSPFGFSSIHSQDLFQDAKVTEKGPYVIVQIPLNDSDPADFQAEVLADKILKITKNTQIKKEESSKNMTSFSQSLSLSSYTLSLPKAVRKEISRNTAQNQLILTLKKK